MVDGEDWKGGDEAEGSASYGWTFGFGPPLTKEQKAKEEQRLKEAEVKAEILFPALPLFAPARSCSKCGNPERGKTRYCKCEHAGGGCKGETAKHEHFHRTCKLCRYEWLERCLGEE